MGFMDKAKQMAEQAQQKIEDAQKQFNDSQTQKAGGDQAPNVRYDDHGRPIPDASEEAPPAGQTPPPSAEPAPPAEPPVAAEPAEPAGDEGPNSTPDPFKPIR